MDIANRLTRCDDADIWTFNSSYGYLIRINYMFHSKLFRFFEVSVNDEFDLGSDHRNVSQSIECSRSMESLKLRNKSLKL